MGLCEVDLNICNFDKRSVGHVAASEGRVNILEFLSENKRFNFLSKDRWGKSTLDLLKWSKDISEDAKKKIISNINTVWFIYTFCINLNYKKVN